MSEKLVIIDDLVQLGHLENRLQLAEYIAFDSETTGVTKRDEVIGISLCWDEETAYYIILAKWNIQNSSMEYLPTKAAVKPLLEVLKTKQLIAHNAVFDCMMIESNFGVSLIDSMHTDTMILAHLLNENRRVGLKELATTMFGESAAQEQKEMKESIAKNGGETTKTSYELYKADATLIAKYGAKDALLTYKLFCALVPELYEQKLETFFYDEEAMPLLKGPTYQLNTTGVQVDGKALVSLQKTLEVEIAEAKHFVSYEIQSHVKEKYPGTTKKNHFNISSSSQLSWLLFGHLECEFSTLTKEGKTVCKHLLGKLPYTFAAKRQFIKECLERKDEVYVPAGIVNGKATRAKKVKDPWSYIACDRATLLKLAPRFKWVERLLEYQKKTKLLSTYVEGIQERVQYGVLQGQFLQHGTTSGRYASRNPNMQNIPRDDKRIKSCLVARPGKSFVGSDFSQLEVRVFASVSGDENLLEVFKTGEDFYSRIGITVWDKYDATPYKDGSPDAFGIKYKKLRDQAKVIALASVYGATANRLASATGKSIDETQEDMDKYFEAFPKIQEMMKKAHKTVKKQGYVTSVFGRPRRMPEATQIDRLYGPNADLPYDLRKPLNLAVNHTIQSTAASICNRAMIKFYNDCKDLDINAKIVMQVHDEIIVEVDDTQAEDAALLLQNAMETAVELPGVAMEAIPHIGKKISDLK